MIWKVLAGVGGVLSLGLLGFLYWLVREISDGWSDAFGYPRPRRWRRG